jgi:hypothetical protein
MNENGKNAVIFISTFIAVIGITITLIFILAKIVLQDASDI